MNEHIEDMLALAIIANKNFANAYQFCKVLAWKFKIINCNEIINRIDKKGYVHITYPESKQLDFFTLTAVGKKELEEQRPLLAKVLNDNYPGESGFITNLVS